ncbi:MAG: PAS domain S-box protein [Bacillota bacterium]
MTQQDTRYIADLLPQIVWTARPDGGIMYLNRRWTAYAGSEIDGLEWSWLQLLPMGERRQMVAQWRRRILAGESFELECRLRRADGVYRRHRIRSDPLHGADGTLFKWFGTFTDIEDQKCAIEARLQLAAIVESCNDAIVGVTLEGMIISWNAAAERVFGYTAAEMLGRHISQLVPADRGEEYPWLLEMAVSGENVAHHETMRVRRDGTLVDVSLTVSPIKDQQGQIIGISEILRDVTQQKRAQKELQLAKEAAEAASKAKDQFLAMLSHELRTPLTPVLAMVTGLRLQHPWPGKLREELEIIQRSVELEARLIDDLLDLTDIMRGTLRLRREILDVHSILRAATELCAGEIAGKSLELQIQAEAEGHHVEGDPARLQQVFWSLIRNATKFTPAGGKIAIRTRNGQRPGSGDGEAGLIIEVADTGMGIAPELLPRVFDAFEQGRDANNQRFMGLGMGLPISKALLEMHGGQIYVTSDGPGRGAVFTIWLPCRQPAKAGDEYEPAEPGSAAGGLRILLVEDHENSRRILERLLRSWNYQVTVAWDVNTALKAAENPFDLLISDVGLPDGNGLDLMRQLRARRPVRGICLSGFGTEEDRRHSREAGFASHLVKPVNFQTLQETIRQVAG